MKRLLLTLSLLATMASAALGAAEPTAPPAADSITGRLREVIGQHLGKPYLLGSAGLKSFDCSGFVWRALTDSGLFLKRTSARKLYVSLRPAPAASRFGTLIFFDNLKHCGIVNDANTFYHADSKKGTTVSPLQPYWKDKISGYRTFI